MLFSDQKPDGSWGISPGDYPGDISKTVEAYLALKRQSSDDQGS